MNKSSLLVRLTAALIMSAVLDVTLLPAADLAQAKTAGLVGEQLDGYLGVVRADAPGDVKAMINSINSRRRTEYERIAKQNGVSVDQVSRLTAQKVIQQAAPGHYVQTPAGWQKR